MSNKRSLAEFRGSPSSRVLSGRERGALAREKLQLDDLDNATEPVTIEVPEDLFVVTSSWFLATFAESIRKLGANRFREHYHFVGKPIGRTISDAIQAVSLTNPLG